MGLMMVIMMAYEGSPSGLLTLLSLKVDAAFSILEARGTQGGPGGPRGKPGKEYPDNRTCLSACIVRRLCGRRRVWSEPVEGKN